MMVMPELDTLFHKGRYSKVEEKLDKYRCSDNNNSDLIKYYDIRLAIETGNTENQFKDQLSDVIHSFEAQDAHEQQLKSMLLLTTLYRQNGEHQRALDVLNSIQTKCSTLFADESDIISSLRELAKSDEIQIESRRTILRALFEKAYCYIHTQQVHKSVKILSEIKPIAKQIKDQKLLADVLSILGVAHRNMGHLDRSYNFQKEALEIRMELGNEKDLSYSYFQMGMIQDFRGALFESIKHHLKALEIRERLSFDQDLAASLNAVGQHYNQIGDYDTAEDYIQRSLEIREKMNDTVGKAFTYNNLARNVHAQGKSDVAVKYLRKSLRIGEQENNLFLQGSSIFQLVQILFQQGKLEEIRNLYNKFQLEKKENHHNHLAVHLDNFISAILNKSEKRSTTLAKAQHQFREIVNADGAPEFFRLPSLLHLVELLLLDLRNYENQEVLIELRDLTDKLISLATRQNSIRILIEGYIIKSKLALLENDIEQAKEFLEDALEQAEQLGIDRLIQRVNREYEQLVGDLEQWSEVITSETTFTELMDLTHIEEMVMQLVRKKSTSLEEIEPEKPIMLLIISSNGVTLFSNQFVESTAINEQLLGGFITAINSFSSEALSSNGSIEKVKHKDYTFLLHSKDELYFTYIFEGQSFRATSHLDEFISTIRKKELWPSLKRSARTGKLNNKTNKRLAELTTNHFIEEIMTEET